MGNAVAQSEVEADTLMNHQQYEKAIKIYSKIIKASALKVRDDYRVVYKRAFAYYYIGQFDLALKDLEVFVPQFPQAAQAHMLGAFIYGQTGDTDKQLASIEKAIELQAGNIELIKWRGSVLLEKGEYAKAKNDLLKVRAQLDDPELETNLAVAYYSSENIDSALLSINKSIELDATYEPPYLYAGSFCLETEKYALAIQYLDLALRLNPENANALFYKGVALVELKKIESACSCLSKAFKLGQDDAADYLKEHCYDVDK